MVKKLTVGMLFICMLVSIAACASNSGGANTPGNGAAVNEANGADTETAGNDASGEVVELKFWDMVWGPAEYIETGKKLVEQFNSEHPNIKVTYQSIPWTNWYQTFSTAIASGTGPDISTGAGYQAFQFYDMDAILPIDDVVEEWRQEGKLDDFFPGMVDTLKYDGHYVAFPWGTDVRILYYRKDLFKQAGVELPKNFDELRAAAKKLSGDGKYGIIAPSDDGGVHFVIAMMLNNGGGLFNEGQQVDMMNERNIESLNFMSDLVKDGSLNPAGAGFKGDDATKSFGQGDSAIILHNPGFRDSLPDIKDQIGIIPPIEGFHGDKGTLRWVSNLMIYKSTKHPDETKTFLKWWSENNKPLWTEGHTGQMPARTSYSTDDYFQNDPLLKLILDEYVPIGLPTGARYPSAFPQLNEIEGEGVMNTLIQEILMGKDPIEAAKKTETTLKEIMDQ